MPEGQKKKAPVLGLEKKNKTQGGTLVSTKVTK
jgi:hypothetical protein